jgi:uncharacterized membrane protein
LAEIKGKSSTGMDENVAGLLTYVLGLFTGIIFLVIEKESKFVRFHAFQSILISAAFIVVNLVLGFIPIIGWILSLLLSPHRLYSLAYPIVSSLSRKMVQAARNRQNRRRAIQ